VTEGEPSRPRQTPERRVVSFPERESVPIRSGRSLSRASVLAESHGFVRGKGRAEALMRAMAVSSGGHVGVADHPGRLGGPGEAPRARASSRDPARTRRPLPQARPMPPQGRANFLPTRPCELARRRWPITIGDCPGARSRSALRSSTQSRRTSTCPRPSPRPACAPSGIHSGSTRAPQPSWCPRSSGDLIGHIPFVARSANASKRS